MRHIRYLLIFFICATYSPGLHAQQNEAQECTVKIEEAKYVKAVRKAALDFIEFKKCNKATPDEVEVAYTKFLTDSKGWFDRYGGFGGGSSPIEHIRALSLRTGKKSVAVGISVSDTLMIHGKEFVPADINECERIAGVACGHVIDEFVAFYTEAHNEYTRDELVPIKKHIDDLRKEWEPFLDTMRSQTILEQTVNGWWYRRNETTDFSEPPNMQWILLHPIFLLEYVDDAKDGNEMNEALGLEIFGANWWKKREWYIPTGCSILALYSDREDVDDWGYGLAIHFDSNYTLGISNHNGDNGVFLSVDLLKIFHDKKSVFNSYLDR